LRSDTRRLNTTIPAASTTRSTPTTIHRTGTSPS
jgi:hypothetical protein